MRALYLVGLVAACGRVGFDAAPLTEEDAQAAVVDGPVADVPLAAWSPGEAIGSLNTEFDDSDPAIRGDGLELFFHSDRPGLGGYDIYRSVRPSTSEPFVGSELVNVSSGATEIGPTLTGDGLTLVFGNGQDICMATRPSLGENFGPTSVLAALSSADVDTAPTISGDGLVAMVVRGLGDERDIWMYTRSSNGPLDQGWSAGERVVELASPRTESSPDLDEHGLVVYFHSDRDGQFDDNIYYATRTSTDEPFSTPVQSDISTAADEGDPSLTADRRTMVFHRNIDIWISTR